MAQGVLVTRDWAKRVDESIRDTEKTQLKNKQPVSGLFYELRPAVLASSWTQNAAGLYVATAQFVINDTVDSSFTFDVCAPTAADDPGGTVGATRFYVVWRGRWELVAGAGGGKMTSQDVVDCLQLQSAPFLSVFTVTNDYIYITTANAVTGILPSL